MDKGALDLNTASQEMLELFGVSKRMADLEATSYVIERQLGLERNFNVSYENCQVILYDWGHIIYYTFPEEKMMTIDILACLTTFQVDQLKQAILKVFSPSQYLSFNTFRMTGIKHE